MRATYGKCKGISSTLIFFLGLISSYSMAADHTAGGCVTGWLTHSAFCASISTLLAMEVSILSSSVSISAAARACRSCARTMYAHNIYIHIYVYKRWGCAVLERSEGCKGVALWGCTVATLLSYDESFHRCRYSM